MSFLFFFQSGFFSGPAEKISLPSAPGPGQFPLVAYRTIWNLSAMTDSPNAQTPAAVKRSVGRPRRLTLGRILDAALEIGLDDLTMTRLAQHIGVSVTVLYGYVRNKDDLVRAAIARTTLDHDFPGDTGQHWSDYMAGYAGALHEMLTRNSQLILAFMQGGLGPETQVEQAETWLKVLARQEFPPGDASSLYRTVGQLVIGCALARLHGKALEAEGSSQAEEMERAVKARSRGELPHLHRHLTRVAQQDYGNWQEPLYWLLEGVAARRGEDVPPDCWLGLQRKKMTRPKTNRRKAGQGEGGHQRSR